MILGGADAELVTLDAQTVGGAGGQGVNARCPAAPNGPGIEVLAGSLTELPGNARSSEVGSPVRVGATVTLTVEGQPGDLVFLLLSSDPMRGRGARSFDGLLVLQAPISSFIVGTIPTGGQLSVSRGVPALGELAFASLFSQTFSVPPSGRITAASPTALLILP